MLVSILLAFHLLIPILFTFHLLVTISLARGGAERSCAMLSQMLFDNGHHVHLVTLNNEVDFAYKGTLFNLGLLKHSNDNIVFRLLRFKKFRKYLLDNSFDVIIDHRPKNNFYREFFYENFIYRNIKRIYVAHTSKVEDVLTNKPDKFVEILNKNITNVSVSKYIQNKIFRNNGVVKSITIYNAYNPTWIKKTDFKIPLVLESKEYILSYARIDDDVKDFKFLIESFTQSNVWKKDKFLVIMGEGKDKEKLIEISNSLPSSNQIIFLPFTKDPFTIIKKAKFVTITSRYEGFPMVLVESLSLGTPIVSLDIVSGPSEVIIDKFNGLLIVKRDVSLFSEGIATMFNDLELYNRCKQNTKTSVKEFSMEKISEKWNKLLQDELQ